MSRRCSLVARRRARWQRLHDEHAALVSSPGPPSPYATGLATARNRIAPARPGRATWMGDRIGAVETRVHGQYRLDLVTVWPRLWLVIPDTTRSELRLAHGRLEEATNTAAWAVLYLLLGVWWWPALTAGAVMSLLAWRTGRDAAAGFAELLEATVDVHGRDLATALGVASGEAPLTPDVGEQVTRTLRKGA